MKKDRLYKIAARNERTFRDVGQSVVIGDKHFEVVKEFVYLGFQITPTNDVSLEIQRRVQTTNRCFFGLRKHLRSSHLSRQTKFTIHKTLNGPVLLYGKETWMLTKREENQLLVFERKVLRLICGPKIENSVYRRRYKHELDKEFDSPNALKKQIALRWSHDQKNRRPTTKSSIQSQTQWNEKSRKTEIQMGGWVEQ
jgi:hypothetical protein